MFVKNSNKHTLFRANGVTNFTRKQDISATKVFASYTT